MRVRRLEAKDFNELQQMIDGLAAFHNDTTIALTEHDLEDLTGPHPWYIVLVAEALDGQLGGYTAMTRIGQLQFARRGMDIHHLFVRPDMRGFGMGAALVRASVAYAVQQGCQAVTVGTHPDNIDALEFYNAMGFELRPAGGPRLSIRI